MKNSTLVYALLWAALCSAAGLGCTPAQSAADLATVKKWTAADLDALCNTRTIQLSLSLPDIPGVSPLVYVALDKACTLRAASAPHTLIAPMCVIDPKEIPNVQR